DGISFYSSAISSTMLHLTARFAAQLFPATARRSGMWRRSVWIGIPTRSGLTNLRPSKMVGTENWHDSKSRTIHGRLSGDVTPAPKGAVDSCPGGAVGRIFGVVCLFPEVYLASHHPGRRAESSGRICGTGSDRRPYPANRHHGTAGFDPQ